MNPWGIGGGKRSMNLALEGGEDTVDLRLRIHSPTHPLLI